ncbi:MAG: hypothetical protein QOK03_3108, partial [Candidatus Binataceae bacterium]|nr:hypothetical protein [Candidatus Binataceae bacterium]
MKKGLVRLLAIGMLLVLPSLGRAQSTDRSEMDQWVKDTASQGAEPVGAKITMTNWKDYKQFMPLGMQKLFEGVYYWKMPADIEMDVGPAVYNTFLPKTWVEATEKYGPQTQVEVLPNGHYALRNYLTPIERCLPGWCFARPHLKEIIRSGLSAKTSRSGQ